MKYQLVEKPTGLTIVDESGTPVSFDDAHQVINQLMDTYTHPAYVYLACLPVKPYMHYKIGYSGQTPEQRMSQLRYQEKDDRIFLMHTIACKSSQNALRLETEIHEWFGEQRIRGEWFYLARDDIKLLTDIQSEEEVTVKYLNFLTNLMIGIPHGEGIEWAMKQSRNEQDQIAAKARKLIDMLEELEGGIILKQTKLPGF